MNIKTFCIRNLIEIQVLVSRLSASAYSDQSKSLSGATIGKHVRHILEFYLCLLDFQKSQLVNYDTRKRDVLIETQPKAAMDAIDLILDRISKIESDRPLYLEADYNLNVDGNVVRIPTSLFREMAYNLEHAIHHQALIKVSLMDQGLGHLIAKNFGVASATIRFQSEKSYVG